MESEDLSISRHRVRVSYSFRNTGHDDLRTEVAFPVPGFLVCDDSDNGDCDGDMQIDERSSNPMKFKLLVDGREQPFKTEKKRTEVRKGEGTLWITHHWEQVFPKDRSITITHEYVPVAGGFFTPTGRGDDRFEHEMADLYCVGPKLMRVLTGEQQFVWAVHYILTTGANWKGPIGTFKLTIVKDSSKDKVSVCIPDTRRTSPTTFEVSRRDFVPKQDLKILFIPAAKSP